MNDKEQEEIELEQAALLAADIKWLMGNDQFKRVIMDRYIKQTAVVIGSSFTGKDTEMEELKAISGLKYFLDTNK